MRGENCVLPMIIGLSVFSSSVSLSGGHKPRHDDERGGAARLPLPRHDTGQQFPAAVCGRRSVE